MPSLMAAHWMGQNSLWSYFCRLWNKVYQIKFACAGVCSLQRRFPIDNVLLCSGDNHDQVVTLCEITTNFLTFLGYQISGKGPPNSGDNHDQVTMLCEVMPKFLRFWAAKFRGRDHLNFWPNFTNLGHRVTIKRGKVWRWSAKLPRRLGSEKRRRLRTKHNSRQPA